MSANRITEMKPNPYEAPPKPNSKRHPSLLESLVAFPGWGRIALLFLIVSLLTALFLIGVLFMLSETPL
jgi:hypothetical protein